MILQPKQNLWNFVHILSDSWNIENGIYGLPAGRIRHHLDFNKLNNNPNNIRRMNWKEHWQTHYNLTSEKQNVASSEATAISQAAIKPIPPPILFPCTQAIEGFLQV